VHTETENKVNLQNVLAVLLTPPMTMVQKVCSEMSHIKLRRRGSTQKKEYNKTQDVDSIAYCSKEWIAERLNTSYYKNIYKTQPPVMKQKTTKMLQLIYKNDNHDIHRHKFQNNLLEK
jgi:hypothetical protein